MYCFVLILAASFATLQTKAKNVSFLSGWSLSDTVLPVPDRDLTSGYDESFNDDCIWIVDGTDCHGCVYCYSISNDSIVLYDDINGIVGGGPDGTNVSIHLFFTNLIS